MFLKKFFTKSVNRISKDFKQKELLPLKLVFFVQASTISVLYPYLTIHMRELGVNVEEAAIMSAVIPVIGIIMPPLAGMVADKIGNFKLLLAFFSMVGGAAALLLLLVPVGRITVTYPKRMTFVLGCGESVERNTSEPENDVFELNWTNDFSCDPVSGIKDSNAVPFHFNQTKFEGCGFVCRDSNTTRSRNASDVILTGRSYAIHVETIHGTKSYHYNLAKEDLPRTQTKEDILSHRVMKNDVHLTTSVRRSAPSEYYFPAAGNALLTCQSVRRENEEKSDAEEHVCRISIDHEDEVPADLVASPNTTLNFGLQNKRSSLEENLNGFTSGFADWFDGNQSQKVTCNSSQDSNVSVSVHFHNPKNNLEILGTVSLSECRPRCLLTAQRKKICANEKEEIFYDPLLTFWTYLAIRVFIGIIGSTSYAMYEVAVIAILREQKADYGLQRIYASIGGMISSPLSGMLIDYASQGKGYTDFRPAFYLYAALKVSTSILMLFMNLEFKKAATNVISDAIEVLKNLEVIALLTVCFVLGTAWGYIESFLFWFLEDLGGTRSLMGITITVGGLAGIPLLILSGPIIDKIGHANVLFIGFIFYAIRLMGYSMIYNPYHCLFFEALESITSSLAITAAVTYAAKLSTTTTDGSIQGLVGGLYFGVGRGSGSLIGGYLMKAFGTRQTYRIFAAFSILIGFAYYFFNQFYMTKRPRVEGNDICKEPKQDKNQPSDVLIITTKPKNGSKRYGSILEKNDDDGGRPMDKKDGNDSEKANDIKEEKNKLSHSNPAYVPDVEETKKGE